jgi:hypothetical protein
LSKKKKLKRVALIGIILLTLLLVAVNGVLLWVMSGPRSLDQLTPYIEQSLVPEGSGYKVDIDQSILFWSSWRHPLGIKTTHVKVIDPNGVTLASFPEIYLRFSIARLFFGQIEPTSLEVSNPSISFYQKEDGTISFGLDENPDDNTTDLSGVLNILASDAAQSLKRIVVHDAKLTLGSNRLGTYLSSPDTEIDIRRVVDGFGGNVTIDLMYEDRPSRLDVDFNVNEELKQIKIENVFSDIQPNMLAKLFPDNTYVKQWNMNISGWTSALLDYSGKLQSLEVELDAGPGEYTFADQFDAPLAINRIQVAASFSDNFTAIKLREGTIDFGDPILHFKNVELHKGQKGWAVSGRVDGERMPIDKLDRYWPKSLAPMTRDWVTGNIKKGSVPSAFAELTFAEGELDLPYIPEHAVKAEVKVENASVQYLPKHPKVEGVSGVVKFTGKTMDAYLSKGRYLTGTTTLRAHIHCPDLNAGDTRMTTDFDVSGPAQDVATFLAFPDVGHAKRLGITKSVSGSVSGNVKLDFIAFREHETKSDTLNTDGLKYDISAQLKNVSQSGFLGKYNISAATGDMKLDADAITYTGNATVNAMPLALTVTSSLGKEDRTEYSAKGTIAASRLAEMGYDVFSHMNGDVGMNATIKDQGGVSTTIASMDLTDTAINWNEYRLSKAKGKKAQLDIDTKTVSGKPMQINSINMKGDDLRMKATAELGNDGKTLTKLNASELQFGKNDVTLIYEKRPVGFEVKIKGKSFDAVPFMDDSDSGSDLSTGQLRFVSMDMDVDKVYLKKDRVIQNVVARIECAQFCKTADIKGKYSGSKSFTYRLRPEGSKRLLSMQAEDAGEFLKVMGIMDTIQGGELKLDGSFNDAIASKPLSGILTISQHSLKNAPVLTKILTIASLSGILDSLSGQGITFTKLTAPFTLANDILTLKEAKSHGSSIGITASGTIALKNSTLDLEGTVVPAYAVNTLLGNIPVIGAIAGGKDSGLIAMNYSIKGPMNDPDVMVNPLSVLTPGFLRNVFNIFDKPAPKNIEALAESKKSEPKTDERILKKDEKPIVTETKPSADPDKKEVDKKVEGSKEVKKQPSVTLKEEPPKTEPIVKNENSDDVTINLDDSKKKDVKKESVIKTPSPVVIIKKETLKPEVLERQKEDLVKSEDGKKD